MISIQNSHLFNDYFFYHSDTQNKKRSKKIGIITAAGIGAAVGGALLAKRKRLHRKILKIKPKWKKVLGKKIDVSIGGNKYKMTRRGISSLNRVLITNKRWKGIKKMIKAKYKN